MDTPEEPIADGTTVLTKKPKTRARKAAKRVNEARKRTLSALETLEGILRSTAKEVKAARKLLGKE